MAAKKYVQTQTLYLAGSGVLVAATSIVLTALTDIYGNAITSITAFGDKGYITLEPDTSNEEGATFTSVTANANGTVTLGGVSTILAQSPYTETSGLVRAHSGGTKVVVTDNVAFWNGFTNRNNDEALIGRWTTPVVPSAANDLANKLYVDGVAIAGAPNASPTVKGIVQEATQAQVLAKTAAGSTGAELYVNPATLASTLLSDYKADTGAANAYAITPSPAITAYTAGQLFSFKAVNANTTASTLNVNALGAKTIKKLGGATDLVANDILAGQIVVVEYDGTNFQLISTVSTVFLTPTGDGSTLTGIGQGFLTSGAPGTTTTNTTATVLTYSLAGGILASTKGVRIRLAVTIAIAATNSGATYNVLYGGTNIGSIQFNGNSSTPTVTYTLVADVVLMGNGGTGAQVASVMMTADRLSGTVGAATAVGFAGTSTAAIDSTAAQNITISCTAAANVTGTLVSYFIQKIT